MTDRAKNKSHIRARLHAPVSAPPNVKMGSACCRAVNLLYSAEVEVIFRANELVGKRSHAEGTSSREQKLLPFVLMANQCHSGLHFSGFSIVVEFQEKFGAFTKQAEYFRMRRSQIRLLNCEGWLVEVQGLRIVGVCIFPFFLVEACECHKRMHDVPMPSEGPLLYFENPLNDTFGVHQAALFAV